MHPNTYQIVAWTRHGFILGCDLRRDVSWEVTELTSPDAPDF